MYRIDDLIKELEGFKSGDLTGENEEELCEDEIQAMLDNCRKT